MKNTIQKAIYFAAKKHGNQMYGDDAPYIVHLACVMHILHAYKAPEHVIVAGVLHDVLEDTNTTYEEIVEVFGTKVANLVHAVTNPKEGTRKEKHAIQYPKIREVGDEAIMVKLADRIANVSSGGKNGMYQKEKEAFRAALYHNNAPTDPSQLWNLQDMWGELDRLLA